MTETTRTNRFALLFFIYFLGASFALAALPDTAALSDGAYMLLSQAVCFLPPVFFYFLYTKKPLRQTLRLNPLGWKNILLILLFGFAIQPFMSFLSFLTSLFFPNPVEESMEGMLFSGFWISLLSVAVLPALLEEITMRGIVLSGYGYLGKWRAALYCALLFGLLHMNPQQFPYAFFVGFIFCFLVERTDSIFASILPHFLINGTTVVSMFLSPSTASPVTEEFSTVALFLSVSLLALLSLPVLALLLYLFLKVNPPKTELLLMDENGFPYRERFITPSILLIFGIYILFGLVPYLFL